MYSGLSGEYCGIKPLSHVHEQSVVSKRMFAAVISHSYSWHVAIGAIHTSLSISVVPAGHWHVLFTAILSPGHMSHVFVFLLYADFVSEHTQFGYVPVALDGHCASASWSGKIATAFSSVILCDDVIS